MPTPTRASCIISRASFAAKKPRSSTPRKARARSPRPSPSRNRPRPAARCGLPTCCGTSLGASRLLSFREGNFMDLDRPSREGELIAVVRELVRELAPQRLKRGDVMLASRLDRDLGIDSLGRTELVLRIERTFRVRLAVTAVAEMDTVRDLLTAVEQGAPGEHISIAPEMMSHAEVALIGQPEQAKTLTEMLDWHVENHPDH